MLRKTCTAPGPFEKSDIFKQTFRLDFQNPLNTNSSCEELKKERYRNEIA